MSRSLNRADIIGNLGADPEIRSTSSGTRVATMSVATNRTWTDGDGNEKSATEWHRVVAWDRLADVVGQYLSKGDRLFVSGRIEYRTWTDDEGRERQATEIRASEVIMLGGGSRGREPVEADRERVKEDRSPPTGPTKDDLPF